LRQGQRPVIGAIGIAGPRTHLDYSRMQALVPDLLAATAELATTSNVSGLFSRPPLGKAQAYASRRRTSSIG
jgi:IclR family transcriptional regulator, acetate operon repressor